MYLVAGHPGTGKTTLAMQFLLEGHQRGESTLYVTLSETEVELNAIAKSHGWSLEGIEIFPLPTSEGLGTDDHYTLYHPAEIELGETVKGVLAAVDRLRPSRVVFDSLSELKLLARDPLRFRRQILALKSFFTGKDCTVMLLDDLSAGGGDLQLESLAHGVIVLEMLPFAYGRARRRLRISKYRGVAAVEGSHDFAIRPGGLGVFPRIEPVTSAAPPPKTPVASGLVELDQMLGGGLSWGTATLLVGPAGSGKSTLAAQYAASGATQAKAAIFLFDERAGTFVTRCDALGMRLSDRLKDGSVTLEQIEPGDMSPGEFANHVSKAVEQGARVVMIDSLNGYLNAIPQIEEPLVRMHELLSFLNEQGVATLIIVAQHGIVGSSMPTPIDVSYLADSVLMLRFFEARGVVRRALSVMKKRSGSHESTIRELLLGPDRVHVGRALSEFQGVLTGVPQFVGAADALGGGHG
jgi:circadian clock protein KaiC